MTKSGLSISTNISSTLNIRHNNRTSEEINSGYVKNPNNHIKADKVDHNIHLRTQTKFEAYKELFGDSVEAYNAKQDDKHAYRRYKGVRGYMSEMGHRENGQKAAYELVFTYGRKEDFEDERPYDEETSNEIFEEVFKRMDEQFPNFKFFNVAIHNDESGAPHMHADFIPYTTGNKRGLETQANMTGALKAVKGLTKFQQTHYKATVTQAMKDIMTDVLEEKTGIKRHVVGDTRSARERLGSQQYIETMREAEETKANAKVQASQIVDTATDAINAKLKEQRDLADKLTKENSERVAKANEMGEQLKLAKQARFSLWGKHKAKMVELYDNLKTNKEETKDDWAAATDQLNTALRWKASAKGMMGKGFLGSMLGAGVMFLQQRKELEAREQIEAMKAERQAIYDEIKEANEAHAQAVLKVNEDINTLTETRKDLYTDVYTANKAIKSTRLNVKELQKSSDELKELAEQADDVKKMQMNAKALYDMALDAVTPEQKAEVADKLQEMGVPEVSDTPTATVKADANRASKSAEIEVPEETSDDELQEMADEFEIDTSGLDNPDEDIDVDEFVKDYNLDSLVNNQNGMQR